MSYTSLVPPVLYMLFVASASVSRIRSKVSYFPPFNVSVEDGFDTSHV